jgi:hypothetical protein
VIQDSLGKKLDPISKITREKRAEEVAQAVESLPSKSKLQYHQKKKKKGWILYKERAFIELTVLEVDNPICIALLW